MDRLLQRDFRAILNFIEEIYEPVSAAQFLDRIVHSLDKLIRSEVVTYDEMDTDRHISIDRVSQPGLMTPQILRECWRPVMREHPGLVHSQVTGDLRAHRVSDFLTQTKFERGALYGEFYRRIGVQDALCKAINVRGRTVIGCAFHRSRRNFSEKDLLIFDLIGPHITRAWRTTRAITRLRRQAESTSAAMESLGVGVAVVAPSGRVRVLTPGTEGILREFFDQHSAHRLPDPLDRWLRNVKQQFSCLQLPAPVDPFVVSQNGSRLTITLVKRPFEDLLLLQVSRPPDPADQRTGALTPREREVLKWVAQGKTNREIGEILDCGHRTIQKHLERIFAKLGVETRTAAAAALR